MTQEDQGDDSEEPASPERDLEDMEAHEGFVFFDKSSEDAWVITDLAFYIDEEGTLSWRKKK